MENNVVLATKAFESVSQEKVSDIKLLSFNSMHKNYLIASNTGAYYVIRLPNNSLDELQNYVKEYKITIQLISSGLDVECVFFDQSEGIKITKYILITDSLLDNPSENNLKAVALALRKLHHLPLTINYEFDPIEKLNKIKEILKLEQLHEKEDEIFAQYLSIKDRYTPTWNHNFLLPTNVLKRKDSVYFINYMFFGKCTPLFDISVLLTSHQITEKSKVVFFLNEYFGNQDTDYYLDYTKIQRLTTLFLEKITSLSIEKVI
jgi:hypothetical protein